MLLIHLAFMCLIQWMDQEPTLFACSIRDNIAYGNENATQEQIEHAARLANAHDFIESFPKKYDTQVGDKWVVWCAIHDSHVASQLLTFVAGVRKWVEVKSSESLLVRQ